MYKETNLVSVMKHYIHWIILGILIIGLFITNPTTDNYIDQLVEFTARQQNVSLEFARAYATEFWDSDDVKRSNFFIFSIFTIESPSGQLKVLGIAKQFIYL